MRNLKKQKNKTKKQKINKIKILQNYVIILMMLQQNRRRKKKDKGRKINILHCMSSH